MNIKEFIREAIREVSEGLKEGQKVAQVNGFKVLDASEMPQQLKIEFDIAIIAKEESASSAQVGLKVVGAEMRGIESSEVVSRVKFNWYLEMPQEL